jgi:hypothetical protein
VTFAEDWIRRARARRRAQLEREFTAIVDDARAHAQRVVVVTGGESFAGIDRACADRFIQHVPPRHAKTLNVGLTLAALLGGSPRRRR